MLTLCDISVSLGQGTKLERSVLQHLSLQVAEGECVVVIGGNGAGKSTMLQVIMGWVAPHAGRIEIAGLDVTHTPQHERARWVATVTQDPRVGTLEQMSILENMTFACRHGQSRGWNPCRKPARRRLFQDKLAMLDMGLEDRLDDMVSTLSGGQRQALSFMMAITANTPLLLLDEMAAALDPKSAETVMQLVHVIIEEEGRTCIMITHNMHHAIHYGDRTLLLQDGRFTRCFGAAEKKQLTPAMLAMAFDEVL